MNTDKNIYKYTKYFNIKELMDFHFKLSMPRTLNDPFESLLNEDLENGLLNIDKDKYASEMFRGMEIEKKDDLIKDTINNSLNLIGIVSLTETPRNLLMWAHYAEEHKGICIEFEKNEMFELRSNYTDKIISFKPQRMQYDTLRPPFTTSESTSHSNNVILKDVVELHIKKQLLTKSDEWIYEKEHRCLIPLADCDKIIFNTSILHYYQKDKINEMVKENKISERKIEGSGDTEYSGEFESLSHIVSMIGKEKLSHAKILKKVNPKSIKTIYIGYRCESDKEIIDNVLSENSPLRHVKILKCSPSKTRFELEMTPLN